MQEVVANFYKLIHVVNQRTASIIRAMEIINGKETRNLTMEDFRKEYEQSGHAMPTQEAWTILLKILDDKARSISGLWTLL